MNHLAAFLSEDGKNGRIWTDGCSNYQRHYDQLWIDAHRDGGWRFYDEQVVTMDDDVNWVIVSPANVVLGVAPEGEKGGGK